MTLAQIEAEYQRLQKKVVEEHEQKRNSNDYHTIYDLFWHGTTWFANSVK